jgi:hypothetical protein
LLEIFKKENAMELSVAFFVLADNKTVKELKDGANKAHGTKMVGLTLAFCDIYDII